MYTGKQVASRGAVVRDGAHPPLIDADTWHRSQDRLKQNQQRTRAVAGEYPLVGLVTCSECGHHYRGGGGKRGPDNDPDRYRHYVCAGAVKREPPCPKPISTVGKRLLERLVIETVADVVSTPEVERIMGEERERLLQSAGGDQRRGRVRLQKERDNLAKKRQRLVSAIASDAISAAEARDTLIPIRHRLEEISAELEELRFAGRRTKVLGEDKARVMKMARDFKRTVPTLSGAAQREFLRPWLESAVLDKWKRTLTLTVRRVPAAEPFLHLSASPGRD